MLSRSCCSTPLLAQVSPTTEQLHGVDAVGNGCLGDGKLGLGDGYSAGCPESISEQAR